MPAAALTTAATRKFAKNTFLFAKVTYPNEKHVFYQSVFGKRHKKFYFCCKKHESIATYSIKSVLYKVQHRLFKNALMYKTPMFFVISGILSYSCSSTYTATYQNGHIFDKSGHVVGYYNNGRIFNKDKAIAGYYANGYITGINNGITATYSNGYIKDK